MGCQYCRGHAGQVCSRPGCSVESTAIREANRHVNQDLTHRPLKKGGINAQIEVTIDASVPPTQQHEIARDLRNLVERYGGKVTEVSRSRSSWTLDEGIEFVRKIETALRPRYHCALTGGVLFKGESSHDLDIVIFPDQSQHFDIVEVHRALEKATLELRVSREIVVKDWRRRGIADDKWVEVWVTEDGRRVDVIIPGYRE